ncbi:MAG TPA: PrgI family protein [Candidatus Dormibacteraeota bacterium]
MRATVPLDVDLEDKLLYGLTATRLVYLLVALLSGFALWSAHWADQSVRAVACLLVIGLGAAAAWGRWRGRAADGWISDVAVFIARRYRVSWTTPRPNRATER